MATFQTVRYKTNAGQLALMRVDDSDLAVDGNDVPAGTASFRIYNRRSRRKLGLSVRRLVLKRILRPAVAATGIPAQYTYAYVTILDPAVFEAYTLGDTISYKSLDWILSEAQKES